MLEILDRPATIKADPAAPTKRIYLMGRADAVTIVAQARASDAHCRQIKSCPEPHRLRIVYVLDNEEVTLTSIFVKVGDNWNCYFWDDDEHNRVGKKTSEKGPQTSYYLDHEQIGSIVTLIKAYERRRAIKKLVKKGPDIFPKTRHGEGG